VKSYSDSKIKNVNCFRERVFLVGNWLVIADRKKMFRTTHSGVVDVTSDHSLITECGRVVKPSECSVGVSLTLQYERFVWLFESPLSIRRVYNAKTVRRIGDYLVSKLLGV
jgi:hypothetical protein